MTAATLAPPRPARRRGHAEAAVSGYSTVMSSVRDAGLLQRRYGYYAVKVSLIVAALAGIWVAFAFLGEGWEQLGIAAGLGIVVTQALFLSHDAAHRQVFRSHRANEVLALALGTFVGGVSLSWWNAKHTKHHAAPNQLGVDPDIDAAVVHFYPPATRPRSRVLDFMHRHQGWWFFPLLVVEALNLHQQSMVSLLTQKARRTRWIELGLIALRFGAYITILLVFLPVGVAATFLAVQLAVTGVYLGSVFSASHIGMPIVAQGTKVDFLRRQVLMSRNIRGGRLASVLMGGLNYQIEHHLFPSMPRPNLRKARAYVREHCTTHSVQYSEMSIGRAWGTVVASLNKTGLGGRNPYVCPVSAVLR